MFSGRGLGRTLATSGCSRNTIYVFKNLIWFMTVNYFLVKLEIF